MSPIALLIIAALATITFFLVRNWFVTRRIRCPKTGEMVQVSFMQRGEKPGGELVDVGACSAFEDPNDVTCDKACLESEAEAQARIKATASTS